MQEISLGDLFKIVIKRLWLIALITLLVAAVVGWVKLRDNGAQYEATGQVVLLPEKSADGDASAQNAYANQLVATSQDLTQSTEVLGTVSKRLEAKEINESASAILNSLTVSNQPNSLLLTLKFKAGSEHVAIQVTEAIMKEFKTVAPKYLPVSRVSVIKGDLPVTKSTSARSTVKYLLAGVVLGGVLSLLIVFVLEYSKHVVRDPDYLEKKYGVKTLQIV